MNGILFKPWKIKFIADSSPDREWQTRRAMQNQPVLMDKVYEKDFRKDFGARKPRYQPSETVYIKEAWTDIWGKDNILRDYPLSFRRSVV